MAWKGRSVGRDARQVVATSPRPGTPRAPSGRHTAEHERGARRHRSVLGVLGLAACSAIGVGGCGAGSSTTARAVGPAYEVTAARVGGVGTVLVDGKGLTLYLFVPDDHSSHSRCVGICAAAWPPLLLPTGVSSPLAGHGVRSSLLGVTVRPDGTRQVTYNGWPLYRYEIDAAPGQAAGQGLNNLGGLWYAVSPRGDPVTS